MHLQGIAHTDTHTHVHLGFEKLLRGFNFTVNMGMSIGSTRGISIKR